MSSGTGKDIATNEVEIPWDVRGFCLLNLVTALCAVSGINLMCATTNPVKRGEVTGTDINVFLVFF